MKRLLALLLALILILTALPFQAFAAKGGKLIAITFDDGPDYYDTPRLLDGLKERNVPVTFFMLGSSAEYNLDLVQRAYDEGHEIASHSWDHPLLTNISNESVTNQFARTAAVLDQVCGTGTEYLVRPPYGGTDERVRSLIDSPLIIWSMDSLDWQLLDSYAVRDYIVREAFDGAIVLLHDIHSTSVSGALMAIDILKEWGYEFVTVSELYRRRGVALEKHERYYMEPSNGYPDPGPIPAPEISYTTDGVMVEVTITADTDAPIYYTVDGSVPNGESAVYTGPFTLPYPCNIAAAAAYKLNGSRSETARLSFGETPCAMPAIEVEDMVLTLTHPEEEVNIYYTLDDTPAVTGGILYTGPIRLEQACKIRVIAGGGDYSMSPELELYCSENSVLLADVDPGNRMFHAVDNLIAMGIMSGMGDYCFNPEGKLTRGMLAALLYRCAGTDLGDTWEKTNSFRDVPDSAYYAEAVEWAYRNGLNLSGSSTEFAPGSGVTRQELLRVIKAYLKTLQIPASVEKVMSGSGVIKGNGFLLNPESNVTRGEMAFALYGCITADASAAYTKPVNRPFPLSMTWE